MHQERKISDLKKLDNNPRFIRTEQFETLCQSINRNPDYFRARPIILSDRTGDLVIIAGNQRYEAALEVGLKKVPTFLISGLTEDREREITIRDNVNNGQWDFDLLGNQFDADELEAWGLDVTWPEPEDEEEPEPAGAGEQKLVIEFTDPSDFEAVKGEVQAILEMYPGAKLKG